MQPANTEPSLRANAKETKNENKFIKSYLTLAVNFK